MGQIVVSVKIFPEDIIIGVDQLKKGIETTLPEDMKVYKFVEEPIAFGLVALIAHIIIPELEGQLAKLESLLKKVKGVSQIEVILLRKI